MKQNISFPCVHCTKRVSMSSPMGTSHRNHCPFCLWSKHVDERVPGDRKSLCQSAMEPIGLTFKHEGLDKCGKPKQGELMIVHVCQTCGKININRAAGDDNEASLLLLLHSKPITDAVCDALEKSDIDLLGIKDGDRVRKQLFGQG